jgi:acetyl-CoA C-acetyltransferase
MQLDPRTPVIVGAGQVTHRRGSDGEAVEPVALAVRALRAAAQDSGAGDALLRRAESEIAGLWSRFSGVAVKNEFAWIRRGYTAAEIATPTMENRAISSPYTKLLVANIQVDQAAGLIVCSVGAAERAGVPRDRWVFIHAGAQAQDEWHVTERAELATSPAIRAIGEAALAHAGLGIDDVAYIDLYSCFPSAVQIGAIELGLALDDPARPLTLTGGLTFAGGPGNNYAMHSIAALVQRLRDDPKACGLTTALGWYATKHALGVYSSSPPARTFASVDPEPEQRRARRARTDFTGSARLEAFTVSRDRDGAPVRAAVSTLTPEGDRALVRVEDAATIAGLLQHDHIGTAVTIAGPRSLELDGR